MAKTSSSQNSEAGTLAGFQVIDRLEVGPVKLEPQRLVCPYTVIRDTERDTFELIYRYEDVVFGESTEDENLAAIMAAQVAINYGLFCEEIVFHAPLDVADRRFIGEMMENTAREIYVNKLLVPNPFILEEYRNVEPVRQEQYSQARLVFSDPETSSVRGGSRGLNSNPVNAWSADTDRIAVLSSGGKESLLSDSLLREIGCDVHALFVNESGRHWFTALNGYRHFAAEYPTTGRVWTNSDRLFSWMLRHLSFVRPKFERVRSDMYPVRLWTVAVFLFGVLPLMRKRRIGRLVIGDEYDTSDRRTTHGISHYNGLYDQSRWFDQTLTRFFHRKHWNVCQFSLLRPCSELLIEKTLVERYPAVQRLQVSCHAGHMESATPSSASDASTDTSSPAVDTHVRPCGHCEKCTRVVGMLTAIRADPAACGYSTSQIEECLAQLNENGAHLEPAAMEHMAHLLQQQGRLTGNRLAGHHTPCERPEIMKLRFHPDRSAMDQLPVDLREPVYRILLEHAAGSIRRSGRVWIDFDALSSDDITRPYAFGKFGTARNTPPSGNGETNSGAQADPSDKSARKQDFLWGELTWPEAKQRLKQTDLALLPVGAIEQHGHHLPLDTDSFDADLLCRTVAGKCSSPPPLVLPLIPYGVSYHHDDFAGTISIGPETLAKLVHDVGLSVARHGITKLVIVNGHGGNHSTLNFAAQLINRDAHIFTCVDSGETSDADVEALTETPGDVHAGEVETSTSLANRPHLVQMDKAKRAVQKFSSHYLDFSSSCSVEWHARTSQLSRSGVLGDATKGSVEKGEQMWDLIVDHLLAFVEDLKSLSLDEIHNRSRF